MLDLIYGDGSNAYLPAQSKNNSPILIQRQSEFNVYPSHGYKQRKNPRSTADRR